MHSIAATTFTPVSMLVPIMLPSAATVVVVVTEEVETLLLAHRRDVVVRPLVRILDPSPTRKCSQGMTKSAIYA